MHPTPASQPEWIRVSAVAANLSCTPQTIYRKIRLGTFPHTVRVLHLDGVVRVNRRDWEQFLDRETAPALTTAG